MKFDDDLKASFIDRLRAHGNVSKAAAECGIASGTAYSHRADDPAFARDWDAALEERLDNAEEELYRRAVEGFDEPAFYKGGKCGNIRRYSDSNLQFLLKSRRRHVFGDKTQVDMRGALATTELDNAERLKLLNEILAAAQERKDLVG